MLIERLDHLVLTVKDIARTTEFYQRVLGFKVEVFQQNRTALTFGRQKINLHLAGREFEPKAAVPEPGSADLCFITGTPISQVVDELLALQVPVIEGPVQRTGATSKLLSVYIRDPDGNLLEIANLLRD